MEENKGLRKDMNRQFSHSLIHPFIESQLLIASYLAVTILGNEITT